MGNVLFALFLEVVMVGAVVVCVVYAFKCFRIVAEAFQQMDDNGEWLIRRVRASIAWRCLLLPRLDFYSYPSGIGSSGLS